MNMDRVLKAMILTRAGFTKNFGGLLASEMADSVYRSDYLAPFAGLKRKLQTISNYENFYEEVLNGDYDDCEKKAVQKAISEAYEKMDRKIRDGPCFRSNEDINIDGFNKLLHLLAGEANQCGFFFTLNQDLFIECHVARNVPIDLPCMPLIPRRIGEFSPLGSSGFLTLPTSEKLGERLSSKIHPLRTASRMLYYIKLHGSYNWLSSDGSGRMVIGPDKEGQIAREPLLKWYNEYIFGKLLDRHGVKLLVIGYCFGDTHINCQIARAINDKGLEFCVVCPKERVRFIEENLLSLQDGETLANGIDLPPKNWSRG